jgi:DNA-binding HxlR family transcriptional regulator
MAKGTDLSCSIARSLEVLGERWTLLILRDSMQFGATRFSDFRASLGIAPDVLAARLATLVERGVMERVPYQEPGARQRDAYVLTESGRRLAPILGALQQWGDECLPWPEGPTLLRRTCDSDQPVHIGFVDADGHEVAPEAVTMVKTAAFPGPR